LVGTHAVLILALGAFYYFAWTSIFWFAGVYRDPLRKLTLAAAMVVLFLVILKLLDVYLIGRVQNAVYRYNLRRVLRLLTWLLLSFVLITFFFQNWYTAVVSFGLISLILGFALQTPITSFIGWIYILVRVGLRRSSGTWFTRRKLVV
jgi:small-conductance mechanosensitive channel